MIYWLSYLYFPTVPLTLWLFARSRSTLFRIVLALFFTGITVLAYARFVEPRILTVVERDYVSQRCVQGGAEARIALFSDTHIGKFGNAMPISRIARRLDRLDADIALVAGDLTYHIDPLTIDDHFAPLLGVDTPTYIVLGNHDVGWPGPKYGHILTDELTVSGLDVIDNQSLDLTIRGKPWQLIGLSDLWEGRQNHRLLDEPPSVPRLVLTHNPDTAPQLRKGSTDLLLAGHTHGGQILLTEPVTCALMVMACRITRVGFQQTPAGMVFVTSGTGMVGLPMRFGVPPVIHVLNVTMPACGEDK